MAIAVKWRLEFGEYGTAQGSMQVPMAQTKIINNDFGGNGGFVFLQENPTAAQVTTALNTVNTNMQAAVTAAVLAQLQGFSTGSG